MVSKTFVVLALVCAPGYALAQTTPSRVVPQNRPDQAPPPDLKRQAEPPKPPTTGQAPTVQPFAVKQVTIEGSSLPPADLAKAYQPFVGRTVGQQDLQQLSDAIANVYDKSDIALYTVLIPDQSFADGRVRLVAVEGYVANIVLKGGSERNRRRAEQYLQRLKGERPLKKSTFQRTISLVRDIPGVTADLDLQSAGEVGAVQIAGDVKDHPVQVGVGVNNRGTAYLGRTQVQADVYLNGVLRAGDQTKFTYATPTDPKLFQFYAISQSEPLGANGTTVTVNAGALRTHPKGTGLLGHAYSGGVQISRPLIRSFDRNLNLSLGLDGLNSDNAFLGYAFSDDRTRAVRASLGYTQTSEKSLYAATLALSHGIDGLGARTLNPEASKLNFTKANARVVFNRALGKPFVIRLSAAGQASSDRLPSSEQFALGGEEFGRAFEASYVAGDYGYGASAEFAYRPSNLPKSIAGSELYAYIDDGKVWYRARYGFPTQASELSSAGGGVRVAVSSKAIVQVEAAKALHNPIQNLDRSDWRGVFNIKTLF